MTLFFSETFHAGKHVDDDAKTDKFDHRNDEPERVSVRSFQRAEEELCVEKRHNRPKAA